MASGGRAGWRTRRALGHCLGELHQDRLRACVHSGAGPAQPNGVEALGVTRERIYVDHGLTGINRERPGLREALAACCAASQGGGALEMVQFGVIPHESSMLARTS